jgi:hypothetical protein
MNGNLEQKYYYIIENTRVNYQICINDRSCREGASRIKGE